MSHILPIFTNERTNAKLNRRQIKAVYRRQAVQEPSDNRYPGTRTTLPVYNFKIPGLQDHCFLD